jgi:hypothetical protein
MSGEKKDRELQLPAPVNDAMNVLGQALGRYAMHLMKLSASPPTTETERRQAIADARAILVTIKSAHETAMNMLRTMLERMHDPTMAAHLMALIQQQESTARGMLAEERKLDVLEGIDRGGN